MQVRAFERYSSLKNALLYSFIVFKYVILILRKDKYILGGICLYFWGFWGEEELILEIWGAKANTFRETRTLFAGRRGDQCIIFRDLGSTDPPLGVLSDPMQFCAYHVTVTKNKTTTTYFRKDVGN